MAIRVGITDNVYLESVTMDDKLAVEFKFTEGDAPKSAFAALQDDEVVENPSASIRIFAPNEEKDTTLTQEKRVDRAVASFNKTKGILQHIMKQYMTTDAMPKLGKVAYDGTGITEENFTTEILKLEIQKLIHKNMVQAFLNAMQPFLNRSDLKFRLLLLRQSKDKHFATFRGRYLEDQPFYESMDVPKEASKVKFTDYEIKEGLNDGTPTAKPSASAGAGTEGAAPLSAESVFGG